MTFPMEKQGPGLIPLGVFAVLAGLVAHGASLWVPFQFDDLHQVAGNPAFRSLDYLPRFFTDPWLGSTTGHTYFFRPLLFATFLFDGIVGGGGPLPFRITSLALLFLLAILCRRFAREWLPRLTPDIDPVRVEWASLMTAGIIVVHPLLNESVLLASGRSSLLMAVFGIAALTQLLQSFQNHRQAVGVIILTVLALLTKETGVVLALLAILLALADSRRRPWIRRIWDAWPVVIPVASYVIFYLVARQVGPLSVPAPTPSPGSAVVAVPILFRPAQGLMALTGLAKLVLFPWGLSLTHEVPLPPASLRLLGFLGWASVMGLGGFLMSRQGAWRVTGFSLLWFTLALLPILLAGLNAPMAEHRVVLAMTGPALAFSFLLSTLRHRPLRSLLAALAICTLALLSLVQTLPWKSPLDLWRHEVELNPRSTRALTFLAGAWADVGEIDRARETMAPVLAYTGENVVYLTQAAQIELAGNDPLRAEQWTRKGLEIDANYIPLLLIEIERLAILGDLLGAKGVAEHAVDLAPECSACWNALGNVLFMQSDAGAVAAYERAVTLNSTNQEATQNLAAASLRWPGSRPR